MAYRFADLRSSTVAVIGSLFFTAILIVASAPHVSIA